MVNSRAVESQAPAIFQAAMYHHQLARSSIAIVARPCVPCVSSCQRPGIRARLRIAAFRRESFARNFMSSQHFAATHKDTPASSLLSQALDHRQKQARASQADHVGPFTLGMTQNPIGVNDKDVKKWKELDMKGKGWMSILRKNINTH